MPNKLNAMSSKSSSQPSNKNTTSTSTKSRKSAARKNVVPKTISTKTPSKTSKDSKSLSSMESAFRKSGIVKPKKTTKSDVCCSQDVIINRNCYDYCKKCGDVLPSTSTVINENMTDIIIDQERRKCTEKLAHGTTETRSKISTKTKEKSTQNEISKGPKINNKINSIKIPLKGPCTASNPEKLAITSRDPTGSVQQYYKNENFQQISDSAYEIHNDMKKMSLLETIKEIPEAPTMIDDDSSSLESTLLRIMKHADDNERTLDNGEYHTLQKLKAFRDDNYFECHNTQSRIKRKVSVTSLENHRCTYRFYLNERLFPEPLNMDHNQNIRCVECHLPLELSENSLTSKRPINGTIQAKVKIGCEESQDTLLMLPVKDSLIIREKRKERQREVEKADIVYFGIIKLDAYGNSVFNKTLPENSLALRYQKGYKKVEGSSDDHSFQRMEECDIVYV